MPDYIIDGEDGRFIEDEHGFRKHTFKIGDRVEYIGNYTPQLRGLVGTVIRKSPRTISSFSTYYRDSLPVMWDDYGYTGVYPHNVQKANEEPTWEV